MECRNDKPFDRPEKAAYDAYEKELGIVFDGEERVDLKHGALLFAIEERVKKLKDTQTMLENLKRYGFRDAIKTVESVDWDKMENWPVEKLVMVGTKRARKEVFGYEIKGERQTSNIQRPILNEPAVAKASADK
jgi:hypothetical protein